MKKTGNSERRRPQLLLALLLASALTTTLSSRAEEIGETFSCSASNALSVDGSPVLVPFGPTCTIDLQCEGCFFVVRLDVNGSGFVFGFMSEAIRGGGSGFRDAPSQNASAIDPPSCEGTLSCTAPSLGQWVFLSVFGQATLSCGGSGRAVLVTIDCRAERVA